MTTLFTPGHLGDISISNRVIMAPLTRMRSKQPGNIPHELNAEYYAQRASAGLIIAEATQIMPEGTGYPATPGIHDAAQVVGWKKVTEAVHAKGGKIVLQLWHVGRISHTSLQPNGQLPVAPSAIRPEGMAITAKGQYVPFETPRALETHEIGGLLDAYELAAKNAKEAGFDGVEIHAANGYLLDQFLQDGSNTRTDSYGGSIENRARLLLEVTDRVTPVWGAGHVGVRLSPYGTFNDMHDSDPVALFTYVLQQLSTRHIAYAHVIEPRASLAGGGDKTVADAPSTSALFRKSFSGAFISAGGHDRATALDNVQTGAADAVAFGRFYISNPDLALRLERNIPLTPYDRSTFYGGGAKGYTDYPVMTEAA
jgi:N-ethylmaleimide reductase